VEGEAMTEWHFWGLFVLVFLLVTFGVGFWAEKLEKIVEQLRSISSLMQSWNKKD
jgi:ABC-type transporter Mla subunit MlaD